MKRSTKYKLEKINKTDFLEYNGKEYRIVIATKCKNGELILIFRSADSPLEDKIDDDVIREFESQFYSRQA